MRILLASDIHSNWPALEAVRERFDVCLFLGDLVDYGVDPSPCIDWVRKNATYCVRGNHDHGAAQGVQVSGAAGFRYLTSATRGVTCTKLSDDDRRFLSQMPLSKYLTLNGRRYLMVHATPRDPMDEFAPPDVDFWQRRLEGIQVDYVVCGHTHQPYILQVGSTTIVNPGSIGLPRDGDPRAGYAVINDNAIEMRRVEYPIQRAVDALESSALPEKAKEMVIEIYRTGKLVNGRNGIAQLNGVASSIASGPAKSNAMNEAELMDTRPG